MEGVPSFGVFAAEETVIFISCSPGTGSDAIRLWWVVGVMVENRPCTLISGAEPTRSRNWRV